MKTTFEKLLNNELPLDFNWNKNPDIDSPVPRILPSEPTAEQVVKIQLVSEDLRDGLHGVREYPTVENMYQYIALMYELGIKIFTVGIYPGENIKINCSIKLLLKCLRDNYPKIIPIVLSLSTEESIRWSAECKQINPNLMVLIFMGTAPSRLLVEGWDQDYILRELARAVHEAAIHYQIDVIGATEHTTQTSPEYLKRIIETQVENGAKYFCIADTIGTARPIGAYRIVLFTRKVLKEMGCERVQIDWHGHRDMGLDLSNALAAISAGADRIHTVAMGIGERAGNTQLESVLLTCNSILKENNRKSPWKIEKLMGVLSYYSKIINTPPPMHGPLGIRSHTTSLGIHTAAMSKARTLSQLAREQGNHLLAQKLDIMSQQIYSSINPVEIGKNYEILVGPWSGKSTVQLACQNLGINPDSLSDDLIGFILKTAKESLRELTNEELKELVINGRKQSDPPS